MYSEIRGDRTIRLAPRLAAADSGASYRPARRGCSSIRSMAVRIAAKAGAISPTNCGQGDTACRPVEQTNAQSGFQSRHGVAQRRGGHVQFSRRYPEASVASDRHYGFEFQLARSHCAIFCINLCHSDRLIRSAVRCHISLHQPEEAHWPHHRQDLHRRRVRHPARGPEQFDLFNPATERRSIRGAPDRAFAKADV